MKLAARISATLLVAALAAALRATIEPGVDVESLPDGSSLQHLSLAGMGLLPFFASFGLLAFVVATQASSTVKLRRLAPVAALVIALVGSALTSAAARALERKGAVLPGGSQIVLVGVGGTVALMLLGVLATRLGVGSGFLAIQAGLVLAAAPSKAPFELALALPFAIASFVLLPRKRSVPVDAVSSSLDMRLVPAGIAPLGFALSFLTLAVVLLSAQGINASFLLARPWIRGPIAAALAVGFSFFVIAISCNPFPILVHAAKRSGKEKKAEKAMKAFEAELNRAVLGNGIALGLVALVHPFLETYAGLDLVDAVWLGAIVASTAVDARETFALEKTGELASLGEAAGTLEADRIAIVLGEAGIPCLVRGAASRLLLGRFGLFIPLDVQVPSEHEARAREIVEEEAPFFLGSPALEPIPRAALGRTDDPEDRA